MKIKEKPDKRITIEEGVEQAKKILFGSTEDSDKEINDEENRLYEKDFIVSRIEGHAKKLGWKMGKVMVWTSKDKTTFRLCLSKKIRCEK